MPLPVPVVLDQPASGSGLLAQSRPLPDGWQRGIKFLDTDCLSPVVMGECPTGDNLKPGQRASAAEFRPVQLIQSVECSALDNKTDWDALSGAELDRTRDFALASELLTGIARDRDLGPSSEPVLALVNTATDLGSDGTDLATVLGCLETNILTANDDRGAVLFMPISVAWAAMKDSLLMRDGARWRTTTGSLVLISAAYDGRAPAAIDTQTAPDAGDPLYVYGTTAVFAGVGARDTLHDVDREINDVHARAEDVALVAFSPCATYAIGTPVEACTLNEGN
jgi:hypothetical protein